MLGPLTEPARAISALAPSTICPGPETAPDTVSMLAVSVIAPLTTIWLALSRPPAESVPATVTDPALIVPDPVTVPLVPTVSALATERSPADPRVSVPAPDTPSVAASVTVSWPALSTTAPEPLLEPPASNSVVCTEPPDATVRLPEVARPISVSPDTPMAAPAPLTTTEPDPVEVAATSRPVEAETEAPTATSEPPAPTVNVPLPADPTTTCPPALTTDPAPEMVSAPDPPELRPSARAG